MKQSLICLITFLVTYTLATIIGIGPCIAVLIVGYVFYRLLKGND